MKAAVLGEGVKAVGFLGVGEGHPHARGEGGVEDHSSALEPRCQVHRGHCADTLPVQDDVLRADAVPATTTSPFKTGFTVSFRSAKHTLGRSNSVQKGGGGETVAFCLPGAQGVPGCIDIGVKVLLRRLASAYAVA